jgi:LAO/AO transport system kinase
VAPGARLTLEQYVEGVVAADRATLGRAITLVESEREGDRALTESLLTRLSDRAGTALRLGITGVPGVGKSTLIDALGCWLTEHGHRVAVLAVDPSSRVSGGSIMGDKTRMARLVNSPQAFVRPSPSGGSLGGVARKTRESMLVCEAAGFDIVIVETVGVGQSETAVVEMVDFFLVLMLAGAGDELQGIKRGLMELADMLAITKADGDNLRRAQRARREYANALRFMRPPSPHWSVPVVTCSAVERDGLAELWEHVCEHHRIMSESGELQRRRRAQQLRWMWSMVETGLMQALRADDRVRFELPDLERAVAQGRLPAAAAARRLLAAFGAR